MQYEAMEWDHKVDEQMIRWVVMECSGVTMKAGAIQAVAPRRDVAYFVDDHTAESAAKEFARMKNLALGRAEGRSPWQGMKETTFLAYRWDHAAGKDLVQWGLLRFRSSRPGKRIDVAYFLDPETAESDAKLVEITLNSASGEVARSAQS